MVTHINVIGIFPVALIKCLDKSHFRKKGPFWLAVQGVVHHDGEVDTAGDGRNWS